MARKVGVAVPKIPHALYWGDSVKSRVSLHRSRGMSVAKISEVTGVPFGTVRRWVYEKKEQK